MPETEYIYFEKFPKEPTDRELSVFHLVTTEWQASAEIHEQTSFPQVASTLTALRKLRLRNMVESEARILYGKQTITYWRRSVPDAPFPKR